VHAAELERLAAEAKAATDRSDSAGAVRLWRQVLALLPPSTVQYRSVRKRVEQLELAESERAAQAPPKHGFWGRWIARLGPVGVLIWKFKVIALIVLGKAKLLLLGLTKLTTLLSMLASLGIYWTLYGWKFGLGLVVLIYIHEMGHVSALRRFGIPASAPMFVPGFGAFVRLKAHPPTVGQDARVGLAGPLWGLCAACGTYAIYLLTGAPIWSVLARFGAWINLFNLVPVWQLDGSRGFAALTRFHRGAILALLGLMWMLTRDGMLILVALGCGYRLFTNDYPPESDIPVLGQFAALIVLLAMLCMVGIPATAR
jgi:Zn-dependent protease